MKARISFSGVVSFEQTDTQVVTVQKGQAFRMDLLNVPQGQVPIWGTTKDKVLTVDEFESDVNRVDVSADKVGVSRLMVMDASDAVLFRLVIDVQASEEAGSFQFPPGVEEPLPV